MSSAIRFLAAVIMAACCGAPVVAMPLRVCADPNNLPFSNDKQEGFENQIAGLIAKDLGMQLTYFWFPQRGSFFRKTLNAGVCDVVMGVPSGFDEAGATQPYYRSTYAFITRRDRKLHIDSLDDPRLRNLKIGVHVLGEQDDSLPPVHALISRGIVHNLVGFSIFGNLNEKNPPSDLIKAVEDGQIDLAVAWGPLAGYFSRSSDVPLDVTPVADDPANPQLPFHFDISGMNQRQMAMMMKPEIRIIGHQWWWEIQYLNDDPSQSFTTANELHLPTGRSVNIEVETADVMYSFWVPALHGKVDLIPGQPNYIRIEASSPGEYKGQCAEYCGAQHAKMRMLAVAQQPDEFELWRQSQLKENIEPSAPAAKQGQQIFLSGPCSMCHTVRGTIAGGRVAPDLTHIGSRQMIAANVYQNNDAYLEAWITHAQSLKPGAEMPDLTQFTGEQLTDLVAYLRQLQ